MKKQVLNYETLLKVTKAISHSKDPQEVVLMTVDSIKTALDIKGCTVFLINKSTNELEVAASFGLSSEYIHKGPVSALKSISQSLEEGPIAIFDVKDDPRLQYPEEAVKDQVESLGGQLKGLFGRGSKRGNIIHPFRSYRGGWAYYWCFAGVYGRTLGIYIR